MAWRKTSSLLGCAAIGCNVVSGVDGLAFDRAPSASVAASTGVAVATSSSTNAGGSAGSPADGGGGSGACARPVVEEVVASADTQLCVAQCNGTITYGGLEIVNIGLCVALYRFAPSPGAVAAFGDRRVVSLDLLLTRIDQHNGCSGRCPAAAGNFLARPLRVDWVEGNGAQNSGADWCRRTAAPPDAKWGAPGALQPGVDIGNPSGQESILGSHAMQPAAAIELDPLVHASLVESDELSIRLEATDGGTFVAATREQPADAPRLALEYCP
jgi:hypothetical protein